MLGGLRRILAGRRVLAGAYRLMHSTALAGLNYGWTADSVQDSGERWVLDYVKRRVGHQPEPPLNLLDIGANRGDWTALALERLGTACRVWAFEPQPEMFAWLSARHGGDRRVCCVNQALSNKTGATSLFTVPGQSGLASIHRRRLAHHDLAQTSEIVVPTGRLDEFCARAGLGAIALLKLDVEGHELAVLQGAESLLDGQAIQFVQFEFGGCNLDSRTYIQDFWYLLKDSYRLFRLLRTGLEPIPSYSEALEVFLTHNWLAESRRLRPA